jgi:hypothetical protein
MNAVHRRIDELERLIQSLSLLGGGLGAGSPTGGTVQTCGLTWNPTSVALTIPTDYTSSVAAQVQVTSAIAQTVTFSASWLTPPDPCIGTPTVTPSTLTFTAGQTLPIMITVPYASCTQNGLTAKLTVQATTGTCTTYMGGLPGMAGTTTTSNTPMVVVQAICVNSYACLTTDWGGGAANFAAIVPYCGPTYCPSLCGPGGYVIGEFRFRLCSVNGFTGQITVTCAYAGDPACGTPCSSLVGTYTLSAGQIMGIGTFYEPVCGNANGNYYGSTIQNGPTATITVTAANSSSTGIGTSSIQTCP